MVITLNLLATAVDMGMMWGCLKKHPPSYLVLSASPRFPGKAKGSTG
jgi:hypothetical protein